VKYRKELAKIIPVALMDGNEEQFENIIDKLWDVFVRKDVKSLAFFPIDKSWSEDRVNDVFQRLNMGGVPLSGADLLLSRIKEKSFDYEEKLQLKSKQIYDLTQGYLFETSSILQLIYMIIKGTPRIAPERVKDHELSDFIDIFDKLKTPLDEFFKSFIYDLFRINNKSLVARGAAILPLIVYVYNRNLKGKSFSKIENENLQRLKQFFILSQLNDWNTQTIVTKCSTMALETTKDFPLDAMKEFISKNNRLVDLTIARIEEYVWFPLKILTPNRSFLSSSTVQGRYKPELDHIFPMKLDGRPDDYEVNVLWNMQPVTGVLNASKGNTHPKAFFSIPTNQKCMSQYDFIPTDLDDPAWEDHKSFINYRRQQMIEFMKSKYEIEIKD